MSKWAKKPETYLLVLLAIFGLIVADAMRAPQNQLSGRCYVAAVLQYQHHLRPALAKIIRCRYQPTCSEYSLQAVQRLGLARGLQLTANRLISCRTSVPMGTIDPVPPR